MKGSEFVFDYIQLLSYKCHKINPKCSELYINSPDRIKNKKATINPMNKKDNKCLQYAVTVALNYEEIKKDLQGIIKIKSFINKNNWKRINFPSEKNGWKKIEKDNVTTDLNVLYAKSIYIYIYPAYVSKHNSNHEKQVVILMISNRKVHSSLETLAMRATSEGKRCHYHQHY